MSVEFSVVKGTTRTLIQREGKERIKWMADKKRNFVEIPLDFGDDDDLHIYGLGERTTLVSTKQRKEKKEEKNENERK